MSQPHILGLRGSILVLICLYSNIDMVASTTLHGGPESMKQLFHTQRYLLNYLPSKKNAKVVVNSSPNRAWKFMESSFFNIKGYLQDGDSIGM